jgi:hypothetical protein
MRSASDEPGDVNLGHEKAHADLRLRPEPEEAFAAIAGPGV